MTFRSTVELERLRRDSFDQCCVCLRSFALNDRTHSGYGDDGKPLYVGDCCASKVSEVAVRNAWRPRAYRRPEGSTVLWRYMDFAKFVWLLINKALHFARADALGDAFEGAAGLLVNKVSWDAHYRDFFREALLTTPEGARNARAMTDEELEANVKRLLGEMSQLGQQMRRRSFVNCWHASDTESEALWRLYCGTGAGVAICTTFSALELSLGNDPSIQIGEVTYIDYKTAFAGPNDAIFRKRVSLSHEKEVRAVRYTDDDGATGVHVTVDLAVLLSKVVVSPFAPGWTGELVINAMGMLGVAEAQRRVRLSELLLQPFF